ncbi:MAG: UvrD-helicase domain-containing protein [Muribaculaceae bacterium]|nr:UvrD-helicase domain-containing protein [Muribaculaceae bacterium]
MPIQSATYLNELNAVQREAVEYLDGPELVIAGAGAGKTRVLTYKIIHLLAKGYEPWRILALTFTNKAAREMRERVSAKLGVSTASKLWMGTFHSVFAKILRRHADVIGYQPNFTIYDAQDSKNVVKNIIKSLNLDDKVYKPSVVAATISKAKNALVSPEEYAATQSNILRDKINGRPHMAHIYKIYADRLRLAGAMDFDDLLYYTHKLLFEHPDIAAHYREFFRYILVDEYQDTNHAQATIIGLLTHNGAANGICVVGDDAQSIYSFRGANLANILRMNSLFKGLKMFKLEQNYRSTQNIVNAAGSLIYHNQAQIPKHLFSDNEKGYPLEIVQCYSDYEEAGLLAARIAMVKANTGDSYEDFAVLYRTNSQSRILEESLRKRSIPYRIFGGLSFFQRREVKDVVAYLRLSLNPNDEEAIKRIINFPPRKIGDTTLQKVSNAATLANVSLYTVLSNPGSYNLDVNAPTKKRLNDFAAMLHDIYDFVGGHDASEGVDYILRKTGLDTYYASDSTPENVSKHENIVELSNYAMQFVEGKTEQGLLDETGMATFMTEISLATDADKNENADTDSSSVTLMTIHAAKGLEFNNVFVVGVEKNLMPSMLSQSNPEEIEEERRLLYVAITRAKKFCMLSYANTRYMNGAPSMNGPSPFLTEIDPSFVRLAPGTTLYSSNLFPTGNRYNRTSNKGDSSKGKAYINPISKPASVPNRITMPSGAIAEKHSPEELEIGMRIAHSRFGNGIIHQIDAQHPGGARITVDFDSDGRKTLVLSFARFAIID